MGSPEKIGDIQPYAELRRGPLTTAFKGFQKAKDRFVLLKLLHVRHARNAKVVARFKQEIEQAGKLKHDGIAQIYTAGQDKDNIYVATEYVDGLTLATLLKKGPLPPTIAAYVLSEVASTLKIAHEKNYIHRDIRPSNILISKEGLVKVTDFGLGAVLHEAAGKALDVQDEAAYFAPEYVVGKSPSPTTDVFSLGAVCFEMLLGRAAFTGADTAEMLESVREHDPVSYLQDDEDLPSQVRRICQQMLKKKPEQRYQDCTVLLADLNAYRKGRGASAVATTGDMKSFLDDPEAYVRRLKDKPVSLRTREPRPKAQAREAVAEETNKSTVSRDALLKRTRMIGIVVAVLFVFGGLSFAGSFFFSKDGSFGAKNNPNNGAATASSGGTATAVRKSGKGGTPVKTQQTAQNASTPAENPPKPAKEITVIGEDPLEKLIAQADSLRTAGAGDAIPDTIVLARADIRTGKMTIVSTPETTVYLGSDSLGVTPLTMVVAPGTHRIALKNPAFPPFETLIDVVPGRETPFNISLWSLVGTVTVATQAGVDVSINGDYRDKTPLQRPLILKPGAHRITLSHPNYGIVEEQFDVQAGETKTLRYDLAGAGE